MISASDVAALFPRKKESPGPAIDISRTSGPTYSTSISPSGDGSNDLSGFHCDMGFMSGSPGRRARNNRT